MTIRLPTCVSCKHFNPLDEQRTCAAFPGGIPDQIYSGEHLHLDPYPGDNGIQYEGATEEADAYIREAAKTRAPDRAERGREHWVPARRVPGMDRKLHNADWTKRSWDLTRDEAQFREWLAARGITIEQFKTLPVYHHAMRNNDPEWIANL